jgi:sec-independent protein translocase protein TatA
MGSFSAIHWIVVGLIVVLLFGTRKLPELGTGLGKAISNFKKGYKDGTALDVTPEKDTTASTPEKENK